LYSLTDSILNSEDGVASTFKTALPNLLALESTLSDFVLLSEKFVVAPSTTQGDKAGEVFQKAEVLGVQSGAVVQMTIAGVYQIIFDERKQERKIERIDAVFVIQGPKVAAEVALESFVGTLLFGTVIQDDDAIFEIIFKRDWSPKVIEQSVPMPSNLKHYWKEERSLPTLAKMATPSTSQHFTNSFANYAKNIRIAVS